MNTKKLIAAALFALAGLSASLLPTIASAAPRHGHGHQECHWHHHHKVCHWVR